MTMPNFDKCPDCGLIHAAGPYCGVKQSMPHLQVIDGGTRLDRAANEVQGQFGEACDDLIQETGGMSAFFIVCFDQQGNPTSKMYIGEMFPMPTPMIPDVVKQCATSHVYEA